MHCMTCRVCKACTGKDVIYLSRWVAWTIWSDACLLDQITYVILYPFFKIIWPLAMGSISEQHLHIPSPPFRLMTEPPVMASVLPASNMAYRLASCTLVPWRITKCPQRFLSKWGEKVKSTASMTTATSIIATSTTAA